MQNISLLIFSLIFFNLEARAYQDDHALEDVSSLRDLEVTYEAYETLHDNPSPEKRYRATPLNSARLYHEADLPAATAWTSLSATQERFEKIRDTRFLKWPRQPDFPRRSSWLYPKDGCFARASLAVRNTFRWMVPVPKKVFAFGNLRVRTTNAPSGVVGWWYHVAPIVEVGGEKYVLDPAIEPKRPLPLKEWLEKMGRPERIKVAICDSGTYSPSDRCDRETDGLETRAESAQQGYLNLEWSQLVRMGRDPKAELGDQPPWL